jgi:hypothetical protein
MGTLTDTNGTNAGMKGWETTNWVITHNYIHDTGDGYGIWLDTENTGYLIDSNYLSWNLKRGIELEISYNGVVSNNVLAYNGYIKSEGGLDQPAIDLNLTGGENIPGSNYNNEVLVQNNTLWDNWEGIDIYGQRDRSCLSPQPLGYCTMADKTSFSGPTPGNDGSGVLDTACNGATTACSTLSAKGSDSAGGFGYALGEKIGFASGSFPYTVTSITPTPVAWGPPNRGGPYTIGVTPSVAVNEASGAQIYGEGTCQAYVTNTSTPASPTPASLGFGSQTMSYFDGCQWRAKNITVENNYEHFSADEVQAAVPPYSFPHGGFSAINLVNCYSGPNFLNWTAAPPTDNGDYCGMNSMTAGGSANPAVFNQLGGNFIVNALMSNSALPAPLNNLDSIANGGLGESPDNNLWIGNTYDGSGIGFRAYQDGGFAPPYTCGSVIAGFQPYCAVTLAGWQSIWHQD